MPALDEVCGFGGHRALDASTVRDLLVSGLHSDPRGIQIRGAYLRGLLDLDGIRSATGLRFTGCRFDQPPVVRDAVLPWLHLDGCVLPGIAASRARVGTLRVTGCRIEGNSQDGAVQLDGAHILHELNMCGTSISNNSGVALAGAALNVGDGACAGVLLDGLRAAGRAGRSGTVRLAGARITGSLLLRGAWLTNVTGPALVADGIRVSGDFRLARSPASGTEFQATGAASTGTVLLRGVAVAGDLALHGARVKSVASAGPGHPAGPAGPLPGAVPGPDPGATPGLTPGATPDGAVCLAGADVTGQLALPGATLVNTAGPALAAGAARIDGDLLLDQDVVAAGTGQAGAVALDSAVVGQVLSCSGWFACLPAEGPPGAVARGPALDLSRASVGTLRLGGRRPAGFAADGGFRLDGLRYSGLPVLGDPELLTPRPRPARSPARWRRRPGRTGDPAPHQAAVAQWLSWFRHETAEHADQPYAALAAAYQAAGRRDLARAILVAQRDDARIRAAADPGRRVGQHAARWLTGYGYRSWYALLWLAGVLAVTVGVAVFWFGPARYIQPIVAARPGVPAASSPPAASPFTAASPSAAGSAALAVRASPSAGPAQSVTPSPAASPAQSVTPSPVPSPSPAASGSRSPGRTPRRGADTAPQPAECGLTGRVGYALGLVLPFTGPGTGPAGSCAVPAASAAPGVLAFGWLVRVLAITLLVVYAVSLTGLTRRPPRSG